MIWSADIGMEPPPFLREKFPPRPKLRQSTNALNEGYKTVYQLEISEMPARMRYGGRVHHESHGHLYCTFWNEVQFRKPYLTI